MIDEEYESGLECARCTATPDSSEAEEYWLDCGDWSNEFYEDGTFGGFCPACSEWMDSDD